MIYSTRGIVLRQVKYGETSIVATIYTEIFGIQSYLVNGVRTQSKTSKAALFQPSSLLDMQVYHNELKNLQRIKELKWSVLYHNILSDVTRNSVALYMVEVLHKCLRQPEAYADLFHFCEDAFIQLDSSNDEVAANFPLYFSIQLAQFFGFQLQDNYSEKRNIFNMQEGSFSTEEQAASGSLDKELSFYISQLMKAIHPDELSQVKMNRNIRRSLLKCMENYYLLHIPGFGNLKTLPVLQEVL